ncbi:glycosyl hydrolase family 65 protein [Mycoplasmopsis gallinacea]|uniref:Maltose phosphorylase domain-containing protein n=1 Tax=Mycoplasmopsis gallinacea TaxID=29556 RepID=A0A449A337_9BACT|nr:glycosyl hydrolase family 65 protein [Mycoplasmopsis gallinacea]VEU58665.1 maltose phosphorylase domain-containing protein [Mycoplasmopsis gallinacea]
MKYLKYDLENKTISQIKFDKNVVAKTESIFALGNGYLGIRSADEEITAYNKEDFFVNGIFNKDAPDEVPELANLADLMSTNIYFNGEIFEVSNNDKYLKTLHIKDAFLSREVEVSRGENKFLLKFERFVSQDNLNVYAQKISVKVLKAASDVSFTIEPQINGQVTNTGTQHFKEGIKKRPTLESLTMHQETTLSKKYVVHNLITKAFLNGTQIQGGNDDYVIDIKRRLIKFKIKQKLKEGDEFTLEKLMSVHTSVDDKKSILKKEKVIQNAELMHNELLNERYDNLKNKSILAAKDKIWNQFDVQINGDNEAKYDQLALEFGIFHLNSFVPKHSTNLNVGAKGLSGEGYQGHTYWDTEFFINPNYLFTNPKVVKNLLTYRYKGIKGARAKAKEIKERKEESNLEGAQFPWEMAWPTDGEVCPYWGQADVTTGIQVPIASRRQEIHVSADVAYAIDQYFNITGDLKFMESMGYEMIIDTAWFYTNRAEKQIDGTYQIKDVMGPNEYKGNIDNNAYINRMAKYNIDLAIHYIRDLKQNNSNLWKKIISKIPYKINVLKMQTVSKGLVQQDPNENLVIAENDQFLKLPKVDVSPFQMLGDAGKKLFSTKEGHKRLCSQLVKQADVVLLTMLLPQFYSKEIRKANFDYYEPLTTHDSSLSAATYAIEAARLKMIQKSYELFKYGINIDLGTNMHSSDAGIHAGSLAAIWQMIVFGFGGIDWHDGKLFIDPLLPKNYESLSFKIQFKKVWLNINVYQDHFTINTIKPKTMVEVYINNNRERITNTTKKFGVNRD